MVQKTVPVYSISPNPPAPTGGEWGVETVRAPQGIIVLKATATYTGAQSSLFPKKTVPVYNIYPNAPPPAGHERFVETVRAPEGISVNPAGATYTGGQSSLIP